MVDAFDTAALCDAEDKQATVSVRVGKGRDALPDMVAERLRLAIAKLAARIRSPCLLPFEILTFDCSIID